VKRDHPVGMIEVEEVTEMEAGVAQEETDDVEGRAGIDSAIYILEADVPSSTRFINRQG
jgi:hypothetical protein